MAKIKDKEALVSKLRGLQGLSNDEKSALIGLLREHKTYGLVWEDSTEQAWENLKRFIPVLTEDTSKRIESSPANPNHILIEGDNLYALENLLFTHEGKVDVIYIDPPYNTGNKDFIYNDNYVDAEDSYRHTKWLSFMHKRLKIARRLLSDSGVIFISIDDYSQAQLKLLCDSLFESSNNPKDYNFLTTLIWNKQHSQQQGAFKKYHEYVLVYAKDKNKIGNVLSEATGIIEAGAMKKISKKNPPSEFTFPAGTKVEAPDGTRFTGTYGDSEKVTVIDGEFVVMGGKTVNPVTLSAGWTQKKQMQSWFSGNETIDSKGQKVIEFYFNSTGKIKCRKQRGAITPCSILPEYGMGSEQTEHLENILNKTDVFSNPKPVEMIKTFISWFCPKDGIVLDFFAGSGTTLESLMQLNAADGGHRQCILVTNNENGICEQVTYERNRRVIQGYTTPKGEHVEGLHANNLRYYRVGFVPREKSDRDLLRLAICSIPMLCIKWGTYHELSQLGAVPNERRGYRYFTDPATGRRLLVILNTDLIGDLVEAIGQLELKEPIITYVFTTGHYPYADDFMPVSDKVQLYALPLTVLGAMEKGMPAMPDQPTEQPEGVTLSEEEENETIDDLTKIEG